MVLVVGLLAGLRASAQDRAAPPLRLGSILPGGVRTSATESWGAYDLQVTNLTGTDRSARVLVFYSGRADEQYGRDVWVPAHSSLSTWMLVGPAPSEPSGLSADIQVLLREPSESSDPFVFKPGRDRVHSRGVLFRHRDPSTTLLLDNNARQETEFGRLPQPESREEETLNLVRLVRHARALSAHVTWMDTASLPPAVEPFDGTDLMVLASGRIADDPVGMRALRQWLQRGGRLWVMLDWIDPRAIAPVLGDAFDFEVVDRVSLTAFTIDTLASGQGILPGQVQHHERPVEFARVLLPAQERAPHSVDGWPAWFTRQVGRGRIIFTTLGGRGWFRPRTRRDPPSPYESFPSLPVASEPLQIVAEELHPAPEANPFRVEAFQAMLTEEIGYSVASRGTLGLVFASLLAVTFVLGIVRKEEGRRKKDEKKTWTRLFSAFRLPGLSIPRGLIGPVAAAGATGVFLIIGESSRRAVPPTVAVGQFVDAVSGAEEMPVHGLLAVYRPDAGPAEAGARQGGFFELDMAGLEGEIRRFLLTDIDSWHWENLALPAGVRLAPFRYTAPTAAPLSAVARFGPDGLEGKLSAGSFRDLADALLRTPNGRSMSARLQPDGTFRAGNQDILPPGQFLASGVVSDRQQQRQALYQQFLRRPPARHPEHSSMLLAWAQPIDMHFALLPNARRVGSALLAVPLRLEHSAPGGRITIPGPFLPCQRLLGRGSIPLTLELSQPADMHLRFQLPAAVLPFKVERARLVTRINAPGRRVTIFGRRGDDLVELHRVDSPLDPIRVDLAEERLLFVDAEGGLHLNVRLGESPEDGGDLLKRDKWTIEYLELEVSGRSEG